MPAKQAVHIADSLAAGSAVGFGVHIIADVEIIVSILAGIAVALSAGLSFYVNYKRWKEECDCKEEEEEAAQENSEAE